MAGHFSVARDAARELDLDEVVMVPNVSGSRHKALVETVSHRAKMISLHPLAQVATRSRTNSLF